MTLTREDEVYVGTKTFLQAMGWKLLAGQPPNGSDHLPVVEVKSPMRTTLGSLGAYKPDLIVYRDGLTLLVECKVRHSVADASKLRSIISDGARVALLHEELLQRGLLRRHGVTIGEGAFRSGLRGALAHVGPVRTQKDLVVIRVDDLGGSGDLFPPESECGADIWRT